MLISKEYGKIPPWVQLPTRLEPSYFTLIDGSVLVVQSR